MRKRRRIRIRYLRNFVLVSLKSLTEQRTELTKIRDFRFFTLLQMNKPLIDYYHSIVKATRRTRVFFFFHTPVEKSTGKRIKRILSFRIRIKGDDDNNLKGRRRV